MRTAFSVATAALAAIGMALLVQGCGQKGPLRLPSAGSSAPASPSAPAASAAGAGSPGAR